MLLLAVAHANVMGKFNSIPYEDGIYSHTLYTHTHTHHNGDRVPVFSCTLAVGPVFFRFRMLLLHFCLHTRGVSSFLK